MGTGDDRRECGGTTTTTTTKRKMKRGRTGMGRELEKRAHGRDKEMKRICGGE